VNVAATLRELAAWLALAATSKAAAATFASEASTAILATDEAMALARVEDGSFDTFVEVNTVVTSEGGSLPIEVDTANLANRDGVEEHVRVTEFGALHQAESIGQVSRELLLV
jgi:hypothetical protein